MPVRDWSAYPADWRRIAEEKKAAVDWTCEECGRPCRKPGENVEEFMDRVGPIFRDHGRDLPVDEMYDHPQRYTLTVHHPDGDTSNPDARLEILCAPCHMREDAQRHATTARETRRRRRGQAVLAGMEGE